MKKQLFFILLAMTSINSYSQILDLGNDTSLCQGETLILDATTSNATYLWQDNSINPTFNVTQQGTYWVEVTVNSTTIGDTININFNPLPTINLGNDTTLCQGESLTLDVTTSNATYLWQDNSTNPTFNVTQQGTYQVEVSRYNCSVINTINVRYNNLTANYSYANNTNGNYTFTNSSIGNFNQSHWSFGDGTTSTLTNPNNSFNVNGNFIVVLTVNDSITGCFDYYLDTIDVTGIANPLLCNSGFVMYPDTLTGEITIVNSSTGINLTYLWNFGDVNTSPLQNPSHTYATAGPFYLCLTIDDGNGCTDMYCDSIGKNGVIFNKAGGFTINVTSPNTTGIDDNIDLNSEINIYPNPTSNQLTIDTELNINEMSVVDITGKVIMTTKENTTTINVADLSDGIYFIQLITENRTITKKFVKQ
jgi:hypothetical protein